MRTGGFAVSASRRSKTQQQMRAALVAGDGVDFVDDYGLDIAQDCLRLLLGGEQDVQRLGCRYQDVRRTAQHALAIERQGVAGAHGGANLRHQDSRARRPVA